MAERSLRVLLIVNHYPPDINPSGKLMHQLALGLRELGHTVDILTTFPHYESFKIEPQFRGKLFANEAVAGGRVLRVWAFASGQKQRMPHRLANYLSFNAVGVVAEAFTRDAHDIVLANSGSFFTGVTAWLLGGLRRTPFIYNVQDIYPDVPVRLGQLRSRTAIRGLAKVERFMYRRAAHVTVISQQQRRVLEGKGVPAEKLSVIPNFVDTSFILPLPKDNLLSRRLGLHDKFVVAYAGNLGYAYDFDSLLQVAARLRAYPDIVLLIIGDGVRRTELQEFITREELSNVRMLPFQPESELPLMRASVDVQLSLYTTGAAQSSLPSKIYEIMASGRPAIVSAERATDLYDLINTTRCGIMIEPNSPDQLHAAVMRLHQDRAYAALLGERGRAAAVSNFSTEAAVEAYASLLTTLTS
jgi:colanic acid biosynthesis glycosyl transferase WcaI